MKFKLKAYSIWEFGKRKDAEGNPHQEDSIFPAHETISPDDRLFILCDGMGGHDAGEVASDTVCRSMSQYVLSHCPGPDSAFTDADFRAALDVAYDALDAADNGAEKKMGTTMTFLKLHPAGATIAHIGDSRIYHIRPGRNGATTEIKHVTEDHSLINRLIKIGELTPEQARNSSRKNVITRAMQPHQESRCPADIHHISDIRPGDYFYMCSDGMLEQEGMESGESLRNIFSQEGGDDLNKIKILVSATHDNSDNHTAIIVHITDVEDAIPANDATDLPSFDAIVGETSSPTVPHAKRVSEASSRQVARRRYNNLFFWLFIIAALAVAFFVFVMPILKSDDTTPPEVTTETIKKVVTVKEPDPQLEKKDPKSLPAVKTGDDEHGTGPETDANPETEPHTPAPSSIQDIPEIIKEAGEEMSGTSNPEVHTI